MHKLFIYGAVFILFSCNRAEKNSTTLVTFQIPPSHASTLTTFANDPVSLTDINCYGLLLTGPEDALSANTCVQPAGSFKAGSFLGGYTSSAGQSISVNVPSGTDRVLRLVGFKVDVSGNAAWLASEVCEEMNSRSDYLTAVSKPYVMAQSSPLTLTGSDVSVNLSRSFDTNQKITSCPGFAFISNPPTAIAPSGTAASLGILFQDELSLTHTLSQFACVGLKLQLQNLAGGVASLAAGENFLANIKTYFNANLIGNFYKVPSPSSFLSPCEIADQLIPDANNEIAIPFYAGGTNFTDVNLFFQPSSAGATARDLAVYFSGNVLPAKTVSFSGTNSGTPTSPQKYALLDVANGISTATSVSAPPKSIVKPGECRFAMIQWLDSLSTPTRASTLAGTTAPISLQSSLTGGNMLFFHTKADCDSLSNGTALILFTPATYPSVFGYGVYYRLDPAFSGNFSLQIYNTSSPAIAPNNLSFGDNLWGTPP